MIQRIQTVYIFIAAVLTALLLGLDFAELAVNENLYVFNASGIIQGEQVIFNGLAVMILIVLISVLHIAVIFLYKKRILQIRILAFTIILLLGLLGLMFYFMHSGFENAQIAYKFPMTFPLIAAIIDYLAIRAIGKDEALVRSLDRIR